MLAHQPESLKLPVISKNVFSENGGKEEAGWDKTETPTSNPAILIPSLLTSSLAPLLPSFDRRLD